MGFGFGFGCRNQNAIRSKRKPLRAARGNLAEISDGVLYGSRAENLCFPNDFGRAFIADENEVANSAAVPEEHSSCRLP